MIGTAAEKLGPQICPAGKLGELLDQAWVEYDAVEEQMTAANREALEPWAAIVRRKIDDLEVAISFARATSPAGMLAQLAVAFNAADTAANGSSYAICAAGQDQAERCLYSVAAALSRMTGVDREGFSAGRYMPAHLDKLAVLSPEAVR